MSLLDTLVWTEKYRPKIIDDCVLPESTKKTLRDLISSGNIPNLLFCGTAGTGKTTAAKAIASELDSDVLFLNSSNESGIDTLRTKITQFSSTVSFTGSKKVVILDESDHLTQQAQAAFRGALEEFTNVLFIFTCNYKNRIIEPLQSRLTLVDFKFTKDQKKEAAGAILKRLCHILEEEKVAYDRKSLAALVVKFFPDFRKTIAELQKYASTGQIDSGILTAFDDSTIADLVKNIKEKKFTEVRQWVANNSLEPTAFYRMFYDKVSLEMEPKSVPQLILTIADYQFKSQFSVDQEINAMAFLIQIMGQCQFK